MGLKSREEFKQVLSEHWTHIYNFAFRMCLDGERAEAVVEETFLRAYIGMESMPDKRERHWILKIAQAVLNEKLTRTPEVTFDVLDETLRSEATRTDIVRSLAEPRRDFLLWELKQGCMTAVINCLSPGERAAFVLNAIMQVSDDEAAQILGVTKSAYKVRLSRSRKKVSDYLSPRCEHVDPFNPCRCPARVGVALSSGFIGGSEVSLRKPPTPFGRYGAGPDAEDEPLRDIVVIYGNPPSPDAPDELHDRIVACIDGGQWEAVRQQKLAQEANPAP